jgi:formylglycine-generating enzyme required for sulfatase activity
MSHATKGGGALPRDLAQALSGGKTLRPGDTFRDIPDGPEMGMILRGKFLMGSPDIEEGHYDDEGPVHQIRIEYDLAVRKFPVARSEWHKYPKDAGRNTTSQGDWLNPGLPRDDNHPVVCLGWEEAQVYIAWRCRKTGAPRGA